MKNSRWIGVKKGGPICATTCLAVLLALSACTTPGGYFGSIVPPKRQVLNFGNFGEPRSLDPHKSSGLVEGNIAKELFEGLTVYDPKNLDPLPGGAEAWEARDDARTWVFHLRRTARWTDGTPVTAWDYVYSWRRAVDPETANPYSVVFVCIRNAEAVMSGKMPPASLGVRAVDDFTFVVEMERPTAYFVKMTPLFVFAPVPRRAIERYGQNWVKPVNIVSNGPFRLRDHRPNDVVILVKNPDYWDAAKVALDEVRFLPVTDVPAMNLYKAGELDAMQSGIIPTPFAALMKTKRDYQQGPFFSTYFYSLNVARPPLDNPKVRLALSRALNRKEIAEQLIGRGEIPATMLIPPGIPGYDAGAGPDFDPAAARTLLAEAGFPDGKGFPPLTISYNTLDAHRQIAEAVQRMWKDTLGISVQLQNEEWQTFQSRRERRDFDVATDSWQGDYIDPNTFLELFVGDNLNNHTGWVDAEYKRMLDAANSQTDPPTRLRMLASVERRLVTDAPLIPIYFYTNAYLTKPYVEGWNVNLLDMHQMKFVRIKPGP